MTPPPATAAARLAVRSSAPARERRGNSRRGSVVAPGIAQRRRPSGPATGTRKATLPKPVTANALPMALVHPTTAAAAEPRVRPQRLPADAILGRGRLLIIGFAVLLAGLVSLEGLVTDENSQLGSTIQQITRLERDNAVLRSTISTLSSDQRVVAEAKRMGFVEPPVGSSKFLSVGQADTHRALAMMIPATQSPLQQGQGMAAVGLPAAATPTLGSTAQSIDGGVAVAAPPATIGPSGAAATVGGGSSQATSSPVTTAAVPYGGADPTHG